MMPGKARDFSSMGGRQRETLKWFFSEPFLKVSRQPQLAEALLQPDFPEANGAHKNSCGGICDDRAGALGK